MEFSGVTGRGRSPPAGGDGGDRGGATGWRRRGRICGRGVEAAVRLQCSGEERESPGMGGEEAIAAKWGKGCSTYWTHYSARFSLILGMRHWIQQLLEIVLGLVQVLPCEYVERETLEPATTFRK
jgi:hypothetical protein